MLKDVNFSIIEESAALPIDWLRFLPSTDVLLGLSVPVGFSTEGNAGDEYFAFISSLLLVEVSAYQNHQ